MYEMLDQHVMFEPTILDEFPNLKVTNNHASDSIIIVHCTRVRFLNKSNIGLLNIVVVLCDYTLILLLCFTGFYKAF